MWTRTHTCTEPNLKSQDIWPIWVDVNNWPKWHDDLDFCNLDGSFQVGANFTLKPKGHRPVSIEITEVNEGKSFTDCTSFPGAKMYDTHILEDTPNGVTLTNKLVVTGPLRWLWVKLVAQHIANSVPQEIASLIRLAHKNK